MYTFEIITIQSADIKSFLPSVPDKHGLRIDHTGDCPRFSVTDESVLEDGIASMREHGYAAFSELIEPMNVKEHQELLWQVLEGIPHLHIRRDDPKTWHNWSIFSRF